MKVILKQDVEKLGKIGDIVKVAPGYGILIIPKKLAQAATPGNIKVAETGKGIAHGPRDSNWGKKRPPQFWHAKSCEADRHHPMQDRGGGSALRLRNRLDIADFLVAHKITIDKRKIQLEEPIKTIGD